VKQQHITGPVIGGCPARRIRAQQPRPPRRVEMTSGQHGQAAELCRDIHQRQPGGEHVLNAGDGEVLVDVAASGDRRRGLRVDGAQYLDRIAERAGAKDQPDRAAQRGQVRQPVQAAAGQGGPEGRVGQRIADVNRALRAGRVPVPVGPAAERELRADAVVSSADVRGPQQPAEEQVPVRGEPLAQCGLV
jgi:hypothetical protein